MSKKIQNVLGIGAGFVIIILAIIMLVVTPTFESSGTKSVNPIEGGGVIPEVERDLYYGGDAYTGMQQASAQAATNLVAVYDSVNQTNTNIETLNHNIINLTKKQAQNQTEMASLIRMSVSFLLLALGLMTIIKHLDVLTDIKKTSDKTDVTESMEVDL